MLLPAQSLSEMIAPTNIFFSKPSLLSQMEKWYLGSLFNLICFKELSTALYYAGISLAQGRGPQQEIPPEN